VSVYYSRHPELRLAALEDDGVVLHLGTRRYYTASESGLAMLEALASPRTPDELVALLCDRYEVTVERAEASVGRFLDHCVRAKLLTMDADA